ncbi:hypothetical protein FKQ51_01380 [Bacillus toyonensis]|uniref:hypothetical protein n=1 Tax=Bacillus toyonensis TaxID=155322 RepID=UPI0026F9AD9E|nr:hypothetical protein [Bacillus toyonensis]MDO8156045.1 hypothetical protein [Bacillus toyonensis]
MRKQKTSKVSKNYSRKSEIKRGSEKSDLNKTQVSIKIGKILSFNYEKWTGFGQKTWLFNVAVHIIMQVVITLMKYLLLS